MTILKHQDDDGDLSVVATGDLLIFACSKGHFWPVESKLTNPPSGKVSKHEPFLRESAHHIELPELAIRAMDVN